jgi:import inner membrane translocase subunit TIM23
MSHTNNIEEEETFAPIYASQEDFNPSDTVSSFLSNTAYDPSRLHPLAGLGGGLDYLSLDDDAGTHSASPGILPSRGWSDDLTYGTGLTYLTGTNCFSIQQPDTNKRSKY